MFQMLWRQRPVCKRSLKNADKIFQVYPFVLREVGGDVVVEGHYSESMVALPTFGTLRLLFVTDNVLHGN